MSHQKLSGNNSVLGLGFVGPSTFRTRPQKCPWGAVSCDVEEKHQKQYRHTDIRKQTRKVSYQWKKVKSGKRRIFYLSVQFIVLDFCNSQAP
jgi:hypothetical protein